jgi:hypothetical protein
MRTQGRADGDSADRSVTGSVAVAFEPGALDCPTLSLKCSAALSESRRRCHASAPISAEAEQLEGPESAGSLFLSPPSRPHSRALLRARLCVWGVGALLTTR